MIINDQFLLKDESKRETPYKTLRRGELYCSLADTG